MQVEDSEVIRRSLGNRGAKDVQGLLTTPGAPAGSLPSPELMLEDVTAGRVIINDEDAQTRKVDKRGRGSKGFRLYP